MVVSPDQLKHHRTLLFSEWIILYLVERTGEKNSSLYEYFQRILPASVDFTLLVVVDVRVQCWLALSLYDHVVVLLPVQTGSLKVRD